MPPIARQEDPMTGTPTKPSLLIVEDDAELANNMALILKMEGFDVRVASDGRAGLSMLSHKRPDLILCDILMPEMDGYAFREAVQNMPVVSKIPFLFISALAEPREVRKGMLVGADDYLTKPCSAEDLIAAVNTRLKRFNTIRPPQKKRSRMTAEQRRRLLQTTPREREILHCVAQGSTSKQIAQQLFISYKTVEVHRLHLMRKLGVTNAASLSFWAGLAEQLGEPGK
jgi:DNA-binding NarL/FixJ family response regulator